jgi:hypothetical protein
LGDTITFNGGATATQSDIILQGTLSSSDDILTLGNIQLSGTATIDSVDVTTGAAINLTGTLDSTTSTMTRSLTLNSGTAGVITVSGAIDHVSDLAINNSAGATFNSQIGATTAMSLNIADSETGSVILLRGDSNLADLTTGGEELWGVPGWIQ